MFRNPWFSTAVRPSPAQGIEDNTTSEKSDAAQASDLVVPLPSPHLSHDTLSRMEYDSTFAPELQTLAAGASYVAARSIRPRYWAVYLDKASTSAFAKVYQNADAGKHFVTLSPGQFVRFPARSFSIRVTNSGSGNGDFTLVALGDDDFEIE